MLKFVTILSIAAMGFCVFIVLAALFAGTYLKFREATGRGSRRYGAGAGTRRY